MSSDRRSQYRERTQRRRQSSDQARPTAGTQQQRRRTSFVPRHGSGQARRATPGTFEYDDTIDSRQVPNAQQSPYRQTTQGRAGQYDDYADPENDYATDDEQFASGSRTERRQPSAYSRQSQSEFEFEDRPGAPRRQRQPPDDDYANEYGDSFIDEDDWYEEEVAAGAARPRTSRARGRRARTASRPSISLPRPNFRRPTMPQVVREAELVQDQNALILIGGLLVSVLLLTLFTSNRIESLSPGFPTHISASGLPQSIRSESALWHLPLMAGALLLMSAVLAWFAAQRSRFLSRYFLATAALVQVLIWVAFLRIAY